MTYKRAILREAAREYEGIVAYLAQQLKSPQAAHSFMNEFAHQVNSVCENPEIHALSRMPELAARGYRTMLVNTYVVLYRLDGGTVYIAHVFHQSQDYARLV